MAKTNFENLRVYNLSEQLADEIWEIVLGWDNFAKDTVGKQIVRSADSVGANIAEGEGRRSFQDNRRFCRIARGSLQETQHWLRRAFKRNLLTKEQIEKLKPLIEKLSPTLNAYLTSIGKNAKDEGQRTKD
ncbi:MAG TPA: four helix bundle protein [Pyrinomonadaceae bacterium]|nr:four helix bundle protein [Pyrinomonadaceae bacterium]